MTALATARHLRGSRARALATVAAATVGLVSGAWGVLVGCSLLGIGPRLSLLDAVATHVAAGCWSIVAASFGGRPSRAELQSAAALALGVPMFGPALAWAAVREGTRRANAHAAFEQTLVVEEDPAPLGGTEDELRVVSFTHVLRHGTLEERRNLLRRLAQLRTARHLTVLRQFLHNDEPELRLCAHAELSRICQGHERDIAAIRATAERSAPNTTEDPAATWVSLADACREYAASGALDQEMSNYWLHQAIAASERALAIDGSNRGAEYVRSSAKAALGDVDEAWRAVAELPGESSAELLTLRAELAFRRQDYAVCREAGLALRDGDHRLPAWLESLCEV